MLDDCRHITVDPSHNGNLFFWHFSHRHIAKRQRTVIWLNGGPGCSSMDGALMEVGPYRVKDENTLVENPGAWNEFANLLFVDQPVGTGFSYVDTNAYLRELDEVSTEAVDRNTPRDLVVDGSADSSRRWLRIS